MKQRVNWGKNEKEIFERYLAGDTLKKIATDLNINYVTIVSFMNREDTSSRLEYFKKTGDILKSQKIKAKKKRVIPVPQPMPQTRAEIFKNSLRIGQRVRNRLYRESGVVIAKYPHVFTVRTTDGLISSYSYNSFMEF